MAANVGAYDVAGIGGLSNDDRNAKTDPLNLSHKIKRCLKTKLRTTPNSAMVYALC
jgi:hypothetical protein